MAVFSGTSVDTIESGQTITSLTFTVGGLLDGANERIDVDGTPITLGADSAGTTTNNLMSYTVTIVSGTATVVLTSPGVPATNIAALVNGITYQNTSTDNPTDGNRTFTLTEIVDSGSNVSPDDNTTALNIVSTVNVNPVDDPLTAGDDAATVAEDALLTTGTNLLANDSEPEGPPFTIDDGTFVTTQGGTITINPDGSYVYMAPGNFAGTDTFDYTIDNGVESDTGTLTVTVNAVADGPNVQANASGPHKTMGTFDFNQFAVVDPRINIGTADEDRPRTAATDDGGFVMVWTQSTGTPNILAQRFQANGNAAGDVIVVSPAAGPGESQPNVAAIPGGGFAVIWVQPGGASGVELNVAIYGDELSPTPTANLTLNSPNHGRTAGCRVQPHDHLSRRCRQSIPGDLGVAGWGDTGHLLSTF